MGDKMRGGIACLAALLAMTVGALPAGAASQSECKQYATGAVKDYTTATNQANAANCHVPMNAEWQPSWQNHYNWCLTVSKAAYLDQKNARNTYLINCNARIRIDGPR
jgi:hypothetical protein